MSWRPEILTRAQMAERRQAGAAMLQSGYAGNFIRNAAQMEWTATVGDYTFASAPLATSSSLFAELGHERNGSFFPG